jgi:hypothetical protein
VKLRIQKKVWSELPHFFNKEMVWVRRGGGENYIVCRLKEI